MNLIEEKAERAHELAQQVLQGQLTVRRAWISMAKNLHAIKAEGLYESLGYDTFNSWLAHPDLNLGRSQAYALTGIYQELVIERHVAIEDIQYLDPTKIATVIPAVRKGTDLAEALADVEALSTNDLKKKYRGTKEPTSEPAKPAVGELCPTCGQVVNGGE